MDSEKEFLSSYNKNEYEKPSVAVDLLVFTVKDDRLKIVLVRRSEHPFKDMLSLPGVFVGINETLDEAAARGAREEAGLADIYFEQLYTWGDIDRDPRMRIISVSYLSLTPAESSPYPQEAEPHQQSFMTWRSFSLPMKSLLSTTEGSSNTAGSG